jgi:putative inorganic carbon (HCO3(-)) transporter
MASLIRPPRVVGSERSQRALIGLAALGAIGLSALAGAVGPVPVLAAVLCLTSGILVLHRPLLGAMAVYASFPVAYTAMPLGLLLLEVVVLAITGLVGLNRLVRGRTPLPWAPQMWWALLIIAAAVLATPSATNLRHAIRQDVLLVEGLLLALALPAACRSLRDLRRLIAVLLVVGAGLCAFGVVTASSIKADFGAAVVENRAQSIFDQPNDFANFAGVILMLAIGVSLGGRAKVTRCAAAIVIPICVAALALSLSRGSWIGTTIGSVFLLLVLPAARRAALRVTIPTLIAVATVIAILPSTGPLEVVGQRLHTILNPTSNPYDARPLIYQEAFREINEDPLTGQGPGNFPDSSRRTGSLTQHFGAEHAHDVLLTVAVEIGLPAALLVVGMTIAFGLLVLDAVHRLADPRDRAVVAGIGAALCFQVGQGIIDFNLRNHLLSMLVWSLVGMLLIVYRARSHEESLP